MRTGQVRPFDRTHAPRVLVEMLANPGPGIADVRFLGDPDTPYRLRYQPNGWVLVERREGAL